jgi:4-amino-4-deoxy-L-arabinose transferase-like glycosyltransferase
LSAFLLGTTPTFVRWASSGYVDLPMAFYYTMAALFILRLMCGQRAVDALLAGVMLGLAAWTKNAALVGVGLVGLWSLVALWRGWVRWRHVVIVGTACAAIAAPWYIRNWIEARLIVPPTAWVDQAEHGLNTGLAFVIYTQDFGLTGWLILIGVGVLIVMFTKRSSTENRSVATLLWLTLPFYGVWWLLVSYDLRFLLLILQLFCVLAAAGLWAMWMRLSQPAQLRLRPALIVIAIALMVIGAWLSVEFKDEILRNPLMSDADKRALVLGER